MSDKANKGMIQGVMSISSIADTSISDVEILRRSRREPALFEILVKRYEIPFLRKARKIVYTKEDAEEVVQDAFTRIYLYADSYKNKEGATFASWAYTILTRVALTRYAKLKRASERFSVLNTEHYESFPDMLADSFVEKISLRNELIYALSKLPETASRMLRLQFLEGKTQEEIASDEGVSVSAVKTRVHRAKKILKDKLKQHDN
ncbi:hypothetical protein MNBD_CPR01-213 [hydrothermal vent metagenome]|uniref:RNA polymerase ECF-type sigma factor n=1 Tax=hydrothermal vent metagenome TaxID=652676 RepID=A0A3B0UMX8_9ZZZZ